ncbi:hypothetical protein [Lentibacillus salicampi]|uniref:Uncharacterized protein n=1 Tax=Lentibacillus salicampi TaxID=175306 RepID=A0A4Y9ABL7_9BACI|nr:hypothetical protein [Lentibacillus salicampi]TFJ91741.1 hypothetical protein E4U82_15940 [Lentibacillus salicampi]
MKIKLNTQFNLNKILITMIITGGILLGTTVNISASEVSDPTSIEELHSKAVEMNIIKITENGQFDLSTLEANKAELNAIDEVYHHYVKSLESANKVVSEGYAHIDKNYKVQMESGETIKEIWLLAI